MGKGRKQENFRLGMGLDTAIKIGSRDWIAPESRRAWGQWMRRLGMQEITAADLDQLCSYFVLREGARALVKETGLTSAKDLRAYNLAQQRMLQILRGLRLTRQAVDHDVLTRTLPGSGRKAAAGAGPPELGVVTREGNPWEQ